jgi:hypothetical protein
MCTCCLAFRPVQNVNERKANDTFGKIVPKSLFIYSARDGDYAHFKCA